MSLVADVARELGISPSSCKRIAIGAHRRYKRFYIAKRKAGDYRLVAQPAREVKAVQRAIVKFLSPLLPVHDAATAYKVGSSIIMNAERHSAARFLIKLDFRNFFPSIDASSISNLLRASIDGIGSTEIDFIIGACLWWGDGRHALCIGAPSSPFLSNAVMYAFDSSVSEFSQQNECVYTRYSDDICISSRQPDVISSVEVFIRKLCAEMVSPRLHINEDKRVAVGRSTSMTVTGLTLTNQGGVSVGRLRKRGVRSGINRYLKQGLSLDEERVLKGEVAFVLNVEPEFRYVLIRTYGDGVLSLLPSL